jgi:hypothetical protein
VCFAGLVLAGALPLFTSGAAYGETLTSAKVEAKVSAALLGPPDVLDSAILGILESVPADEAGQVAADILAAASNATVVQKAAIGKALATHISALANEGHLGAARAVMAAMEKARPKRDSAALFINKETATVYGVGLNVTLPTGPVPGSITPELGSPAE